ncbi:hypothetical protein QN277_007380 [Acacia crassicarpa]|uniref:Uncharacterized protein n=1 Tax=Acacia crassicarpa TaxID=499986 RepID=A0AAE1M9W9_9FABA|nr:hypothetical protein QN277_007380 [Acacia crassicarpa]
MAFYTTKLSIFALIWCSVIICLSSGSPTFESISPSNGEQVFEMFQQWVMEHGRNYSNTEESKTRYQIFQRNLMYITQTNAKRSKSPSGHRLGLNKFADMSPEEFKRVYLRLPEEAPATIAPATSSPGFVQQKESCEEAPSSMDWTNKGVVTPVKDQQQCGCCWAFAATGAIESVNAIATGELVSLSEQELLDCDSKSSGCSGGFPSYAFDFVIGNGGISKEDDYPYAAQQGDCRANMQNGVAKISSYQSVEQSDDALLCATSRQPVTVGLDARSLQLYQGGIFDGGNCERDSNYKNHAVLIVGYGSKDGKDYWIVKNSWGENWGSNGYFFIQRNTDWPNGVCAINTAAYIPII